MEWEYLLDRVTITGETHMDDVNVRMDQFGKGCWELVGFTPMPQLGTFMCCYKRQKATGPG